MRRLFHIDDIADNSSKSIQSDEINYFAVKKTGQLFLYENRCPHLGIELNWQENRFLDYDNTLIQCSTHGALFLIDNGRCVSGPCLDQQLTAIPFEINDGFVTLGKND